MPNQYTKAKELGLPKPEISSETRKKLSEATTRMNRERFADPAYRKKISNAMKRAVKEHPESYSSSNRGRTKKIDKYNLSFQGKWEVEFYEWCIENFIRVEKPIIGFYYEWNGERTYFPDFYLPEHDLYVEVKGYETERDRAKWSYFPHRLLIVRALDVSKIRNKDFSLTIPNNPKVGGS